MAPHWGQLFFAIPDPPAHPEDRKAKTTMAMKAAVIAKYFCLIIRHLP
jgi:hypothetical protein